jgi:hypothetical protein
MRLVLILARLTQTNCFNAGVIFARSKQLLADPWTRRYTRWLIKPIASLTCLVAISIDRD